MKRLQLLFPNIGTRKKVWMRNQITKHESFPSHFSARKPEKNILMKDEQKPNSIKEVIDQTVDEIDGATVNLEVVLTSFGSRSYGPLLLFVSLIALFPLIGGIPGMSIWTGKIVILVSAQLLFMRRHPWLPRKMLAISISRENLTKFANKTRPWAERIGRFVGQRWTLFTQPPFVNLVALICILWAATFFSVGANSFRRNAARLAPIFVFGVA